MKKILQVAIALIIILFSGMCVVRAQWIQQSVPNNTGILLSIDFAKANTGVTGGWYNFYGKALYTSDGGTNWLPFIVPDSSRAFVTVTLIDSLTGFMAGAGSYQADWNAGENPSGVCFYRLQTEGFTEIKKMILTK